MTHALAHGGLELPQGRIALLGATVEDMGVFAATLPMCEVLQGFKPESEGWAQRGFTTSFRGEGPFDAVIVSVARARDLTEDRIARACALAPGGLIVVTGAKSDGIEPILKALKSTIVLDGQLSKAHGRCAWFHATDALADWARPDMTRNGQSDFTAPGSFSASGADAASVALAEALPDKIKGAVADLGAGWGWLSREILKRDGVKSLHAVEADHATLDCARVNLQGDDRVTYHWADATRWVSPQLLDAVIMNPPFHTTRKAEPDLGRAFIQSAARNLAPHGAVWLVANRHLPYESTLNELFRNVDEIAGTNRFKILTASRPLQRRR
jgi:16S rRNA (guanine1207-N2)-methyltransferase